MTKVKVCGITNLKSAFYACFYGADAVGFIFYKKSPRYIAPAKAKKIISLLPKHILKVGVFVDAKENDIKRIAGQCRLDMIQLHGNESPDFCGKFKGYKIIKALRIKNKDSLKNISAYKVYAYLFDTYAKGKFGGTAKTFDWRLLKLVKRLKKPVFLSGGLNPSNVSKAIRAVRPEWVDASSSLESSPGKKDSQKIKRFIAAVKEK